MRFSEQWLREWVNPPLRTEQLAAQLTRAGLEVDAIAKVAPDFDKVVVGQVLSTAPHPNAERLKVCSVDVGAGEPLQIVCGAANVAPGQHVPAALVGSVLPGDKRIEKARLRGVESFGMLCSAVELGIAESADGLLVLPGDAPVGQSVRSVLGLDDVTLELGLTPNRGDCLSIVGVAREVAALNGLELAPRDWAPVAARIADTFPIVLQAPTACPRYAGRVLRGIRRDAVTPLWMKERLRRSGVRSISPVVDVTNYILLELGQPMHAFDLAKLNGGIEVREARAGESLTLLDGQAVKLQPGTLVIADAVRPVALAGIMGGQASAVSDTTQDLFLESAFFAPAAMAGRARQYGLATESSRRFERGVDPELARRALERATALLLEIVGGEAGPVTEAVEPDHLPERAAIALRGSRLERMLGCSVDGNEVEGILQRLGMQVLTAATGDEWRVTPPSYRFDIGIEADLIEEVARVHGYGELPMAEPRVGISVRPPSRTPSDARAVRDLLVARGYHEAITYSFVDPQLQQRVQPDIPGIRLANPIAADMAEMRTTLWPGLLQALLYNLNRQQSRVRLFEVGNVYLPGGQPARERAVVAGVASGSALPEQWGLPNRRVDFYDVKADVEALLGLTGRGREFIFKLDRQPSLHPGQCAAIHAANGNVVGWLGTVHPELQRALDLPQPVVLFQLELVALSSRLPRFEELSKFPAIRRDIAIVVRESVTAQAVEACIKERGGQRLREVQLFDVYRGERIDSGGKSLALGLTIQDTSRTLTDDDVDALVKEVVEALHAQLGATLRE